MADDFNAGAAQAGSSFGLALINLDQTPGEDAGRDGRFRANQIASVVRFTPALMAGNGVAAVCFAWLAWGTANQLSLASWAGALLALSLLLAGSIARNRGKVFASASIASIRKAEACACLLGFIWASFPPLFYPGAAADLRILMVALVLASAGIGAFALASIPSAAIIYAWLLTSSLFAIAIMTPAPAGVVFAIMAPGYGTLLTTMILAKYRSSLQGAADELKFERRGEIISLLLKDFEQESSDWLWETDAGGRLVYFSGRLAELLHRTPERLKGATLAQATGSSSQHENWAAFESAIAARQPVRDAELPVRTTDGARWWMLTAKPILTSQGKFRGYRGVGRDITEQRKSAAELLLAKESAEAANAAKSQFLATMSHELKTPLNAIVGFSDLLGIPHEPHARPENQAEYIKAIKDGGQHLRSLIDDILDVTRIEKGTFRLLEQDCDLAELAEIAAKMCRDIAVTSSVTISARLMEGLEVQGDATRIKQVLINLLTNAVKFSPAGGEVALHFERAGDGGVAVVVRDHGEGIAADDIERIFEPFVQAEAGTTRRFGGLGLGLAIARKIARLHGGEVALDSAIGKGTAARLTLPAARVRWPQAKAA